MKSTPPFSIIVLILLVQVNLVSCRCSSDERSLLLQFKKSLSFPANISGWNHTSGDCCTWEGITCNEEGHVTQLYLSYRMISGRLDCSSSLLSLQYLKRLDLSYNNIESSTILSCICNLKSLEFLELLSNRLTGRIPSFHQCKFLTEVFLSHNFLNGSIPSSLLSHPTLKIISLNENQFSGQLHENPNASFSNLQSLNLRHNKLEGPIPMSTFTLMRQLDTLILSFNKFSGSIEQDTTKGFDNFRHLDLSYNNLSIKLATNSFPNIKVLQLASCKLGKFPPLTNIVSKIDSLDLSNNDLYGEIPNWIWEFEFLNLNLSYNKLVGFQEPYSDVNVEFLDLQHNHLGGKIPTLPPGLKYIDLSYNNFTSIPVDITSIHSQTFFSISNNQVTGVIPEFICNFRSLELLDLSDNRLSGQIPPCIFQMWKLKVLDLQRNNLSGQISDLFSDDCKLMSFYVNGNLIRGHIPPSLANCSSLQVLDLGHNNMVGSFPCFLMKISTLQVLILRSNYFNGRIVCPQINGTWSMLQIVDLAHNNFNSDLLGGFFKNWQAMMVQTKFFHTISVSTFIDTWYYQDSVEMIHKGQAIELVNILTTYTSIDLSCNNFQGAIPEEFGKFQSLHFLNLSHNSFAGSMPSSLGNMKQLESFDLSVNQLNGEIPTSLANLNFLAVLNLSNNQLEGKIPTSNQLQLFSADSFVGNKGLCGPPLTMNCSNFDDSIDDASVATDIDWNIIAAVIGFIFGFGIITGPLLFCNRWRKLYFERMEDIAYWIIPLAILRKWWSWKTQRKRR